MVKVMADALTIPGSGSTGRSGRAAARLAGRLEALKFPAPMVGWPPRLSIIHRAGSRTDATRPAKGRYGRILPVTSRMGYAPLCIETRLFPPQPVMPHPVTPMRPDSGRPDG